LFLGLKPKSYQQLQLSLQSFCLQAFPPFFAPFCFFALFPSFIGLFRLRKGGKKPSPKPKTKQIKNPQNIAQ